MYNTLKMLIDAGRTNGIGVKIGKLYAFGLLTDAEMESLMAMLPAA